ncbi:calmodulin-like protein 4 [Vigna radiata var. radiata]|uniref:Calmodulin-like protein 4 n=1 Tax=Vigna radiata var. radiata TaxID=3916 RepID=A0A1S3UBL3_VIGRR|nr:calmodulin-like protein 4 [Vigna radiata var. radiata]
MFIPSFEKDQNMKNVSRSNLPLKIIDVPDRKDFHESVMMQKIMISLKEADRNKDGRYNKDELKHALKDLGAFFPAWRVRRAFNKVDVNHDGQISGKEIDSLLEYLCSHGYGK